MTSPFVAYTVLFLVGSFPIPTVNKPEAQLFSPTTPHLQSSSCSGESDCSNLRENQFRNRWPTIRDFPLRIGEEPRFEEAMNVSWLPALVDCVDSLFCVDSSIAVSGNDGPAGMVSVLSDPFAVSVLSSSSTLVPPLQSLPL